VRLDLKDVIKIVILCVVVLLFTQLIRHYSILETIGMIVFVLIVYLVASLPRRGK